MYILVRKRIGKKLVLGVKVNMEKQIQVRTTFDHLIPYISSERVPPEIINAFMKGILKRGCTECLAITIAG